MHLVFIDILLKNSTCGCSIFLDSSGTVDLFVLQVQSLELRADE